MSRRPRIRLWLPLWVTPRWYALAGSVALLLACASGFPALRWGAAALALALVAATLADALLGPAAAEIRIERIAPERATLQAPCEIVYRVTNAGRSPVRAGIFEAAMRTLRVPIEATVADVPAATSVTVASVVLPVARGGDTFGTFVTWYENAYGLLRRRRSVEAPADIRVYPDLSAVERHGRLNARNHTIEAGLRRMRRRGMGTEFESLREWSTGDAFRTIDWKATARRGKIMVAQHESERSQSVLLLLDCGRLTMPRTGSGLRTLDYAVTAALSVAAVAGLASDRVGALAFAREILVASAPRSTRASLARLSDLLCDLEPRFEEADYARAFAYVRAHVRKRALVVFLSDALETLARPELYAELTAMSRRHVVVCAGISDAAVASTLAAEPTDVVAAYRSAAALALARERRAAITLLQRAGALVIDVPAKDFTTALIDRYLQVKERGLL